nr:MAG TPA: hypothetical protein [Caudoviricetes sp.]
MKYLYPNFALLPFSAKTHSNHHTFRHQLHTQHYIDMLVAF